MKRFTPHRLGFVAAGIISALPGTAARATIVTRVQEEAVDNYCDGTIPITAIAEADNFVNGLMNAPGTIWTRGSRYVDSCAGKTFPFCGGCSPVWDTDFIDPQRTGNYADNDGANFDQSGGAISYVSVHGDCDDTTTTACTSSAQCGAGKVCVGHGPPNNSPGWCQPNLNRRLWVGMGGSYNQHYGYVDYTGGQMALGEDATSGTWGNAGTDGGVNFAAVVNSCGIRPGFIFAQSRAMFAGVQTIGMVMPVTPQDADDWDAPERGTAFAQAYRTNPNGSISVAWRDSLLGVPQSRGKSCPGMNSTYTNGGGNGITGCGAQISLSMDANEARAEQNNGGESWVQTQNTANKAIGGGYEAWIIRCNYACVTFPFTL
jgi:hypothetical protein